MSAENSLFGYEGMNLPYSVEAEQSVLGSMIVDPNCINEVASEVTPDFFYMPQHREIYLVLSSMFDLNQAIDFVSLLETLKKKNVFDETGGKAYLTQLVQGVPSSANVSTYIAILKERYYARSLLVAAEKIIKDVNENKKDASELLDSAEEDIYNIRQGISASGLTHIKQVIESETYDRLTKISDPETRDDYIGIDCGIGPLNTMITGLNKSDLIIVGARPGMGKTSFVLNIARNVALLKKKRVCFFSLEMSRDQLVQRLLSSEAGIKSEKLRTGDLDRNEWTRLTAAGETLSETQIYIDETSTITVPAMKAKVKRLGKVDLVIVDYLQLMNSSEKKENRVNEVSDITRRLKIMAKELKIPVIVCAQLSRGPETKGKSHKPMLSDLRESGSIEQDADIVLFLYREKYYENEKLSEENSVDKTKAECIIAKNRHGETGKVNLRWDGEFTRFTAEDNIH